MVDTIINTKEETETERLSNLPKCQSPINLPNNSNPAGFIQNHHTFSHVKGLHKNTVIILQDYVLVECAPITKKSGVAGVNALFPALHPTLFNGRLKLITWIKSLILLQVSSTIPFPERLYPTPLVQFLYVIQALFYFILF